MGLIRRKVPSHLIRIHPHNVRSKDWIILLEAGTIIGPSPERLRVARATQERTIVRRYNIWFRAEHFLVVEGYDPRIHAIYFVLNFTNMILRKNLCLYKATRSAG
jgi:hypothetical protein